MRDWLAWLRLLDTATNLYDRLGPTARRAIRWGAGHRKKPQLVPPLRADQRQTR
jgi:hypothetical protein